MAIRHWPLCHKVRPSLLASYNCSDAPEASNPGAPWPPRSPHEVLMGTPRGRDRLRRLAERTSPSPSPIKRFGTTPSLHDRTKKLLALGTGASALSDDNEEDDDDEETLQLQLQEIQARLKLKRLQKKAAQASEVENKESSLPPERARSAAAGRTQPRLAESREQQTERSKSQNSIHVPASPIKRLQPEPSGSPTRVLLGIDKGWKASDVSLRKAPSLRKENGSASQAMRNPGPYLQRSRSQTAIRDGVEPHQSVESKPKSFNERIAALRSEETARLEREARVKKNRSTAFDINHEELQRYKETAIDLPEAPPNQPPEFSREQILTSFNKTTKAAPRSKAVSTASITAESSTNTARGGLSKSKRKPIDVPEAEATQFEPYSSQHLSKRILPHQVVTRTFSGKKTYIIPELLKVVKAPEYDPPEIEDDWVLLGIVAWKSDPKSKQDGSKYMVLKITDLKWELELFLFDSAFTRFWKLTIGTVIAILNPNIWAPPKGRIDTGHFSLTLNSSEDTILEIGTARDLGFCKSIKKDGKECGSWVDKRHTEFCDFHVNLVFDKTKAKRPEVSSMDFGRGSKSGFGAEARKYKQSQDMTWHTQHLADKEYERKNGIYSRDAQTRIFIGGRTPAELLDDADYDPDMFHHRGMSKEERMKKQLVALEKERELARKLGETGTGAGAEYLRTRHKSQADSSSKEEPATAAYPPSPPTDAATLGLLKSRATAATVHLSPVKRKRAATAGGDSISSSTTLTSSIATATTSTTAPGPMGWGKNLSKELSRMKNGESLRQQQQQQPVRKKTRFLTEKGIREAGRESFGGEVVKNNNDDDDSNDDLDIIR